MITDKQRREVAERLRRQAYWMNKNKDWYDNDDSDQGNRAYRNIADSVEEGSNFGNHYEETVRKLADLIDRPTCETIEHGRPHESHVCKSCSRCSYGWFEDIHDKPYSYCPNCGAEVVNDD